MKPFEFLDSAVLPIDQANVDTDQILPARYLQKPRSDDFGAYLFRDLRRRKDGTEEPGFVLNQPAYRNSKILIARRNFGCGSSREHAAWALLDMGVKAVIAPSFSDIFSGNAFKNGILTVALPQEQVDRLMEVAETDPIAIDLEHQTVTTPFQDRFTFEIDPFRKFCLQGGLDEVALTLQRDAAIADYERRVAAARPWVARGTGIAA